MSNNPVLENREIKKHLVKAVFPIQMWGMLFCIILILLNFIMLNYWIVPLVRNADYLEGQYSQVIVSNELYPEYCSEYQFPELITVSSESNQRINANVYMPNGSANNIFLNCALKQNELAISEKAAKKLNVTVGSRVYLDFSISEQPKEYLIVSIIPFCWNYYDVLDNSDFSVVHIGYDENLVQRSSLKAVYFLNDTEYIEYMDKNYSYSDHYDFSGEIKTIRSRISILIGACILVSSIISLGYLMFLSRRTKSEAVKYHYNGYEASFVKKIHKTDYLFLYIIPICILGICIAIMSAVIHYIAVIILAIVLIDLVMVAITYFKEIKAYGKAY